MKKAFQVFLFISLAFLCVGARAAVAPPRTDNGTSLQTIDFVGAKPCVVTMSASVATLCISTLTALPARGIVYGVIASSISASEYLVFRDTTGSGVAASTVALVYNYTSSLSSGGFGTAGTNYIKFPVPLSFQNAISVIPSAADIGGNSIWTVLYREMKATE